MIINIFLDADEELKFNTLIFIFVETSNTNFKIKW